ncbi:MAG: SPOR domain-containing protein [Rhizobiaceae bacterium]|nr:SPOR domain-containing protein [Rhizobiaceae bacterium]MCV0409129.1 SPOR domain-containing protein [Rhizobiaceae bacterium]
MAERSQRKIADESDFHPNDPFAELTRIMGFDPRVAELGEQQTVAPEAVDDDLGIDLERELLGEFDVYGDQDPDDAPDDAVVQDQAPEAAVALPEAEAHELSVGGEAVGFVHEEPASFGAGEASEAAAARQDVDHDDFVLDEDFAASIEAEIALEAGDVTTDDPQPGFAPDDDGTGSEPASAVAGLADTRGDDGDRAAEEMADEIATFAEPEQVEAAFDPAVWGDEPTIAVPDAAEARADDDDHAAEEVTDEAASFAEVDSSGFASGIGEEPVVDLWGEAGPEPAAETDAAGEVDDMAFVDMDFQAEASEAAEETSIAPELRQANEVDVAEPEPEAETITETGFDVAAAPADEALAAEWEGEPETQDAASEFSPAARESSLEDELMALLADEGAATRADGVEMAGQDDLPGDIEPDDGQEDESMAAEPDEQAASEIADEAAPSDAATDPFEELHGIVAATGVAASVEASARPRFSLATPTMSSRNDVRPIAESLSPAADSTSDGAVAPAEPVSAEPAPEPSAASTSMHETGDRGYDDSAAAAIYDDSDLTDIPGGVDALADDLDLPQPAVHQPEPAHSDFDDFDFDLVEENAVDLAGPKPEEGAPPAFSDDLNSAIEDFVADMESASGFSDAAVRPAQTATTAAMYGAGQVSDERFTVDPTDDDDYSLEFAEEEGARGAPRSNRVWVAGLLACVVVFGGIGTLSYVFGGGSGGGATTIVRADPDPVKVKPENPGGAVVPNQDNPVYNSVAGAAAKALPVPQDNLVSGSEEPVDLPALDGEGADSAAMPQESGNDVAEALPGVEISSRVSSEPRQVEKNEDRVQPAQADDGEAEAQAILAVEPRRVKTMIVRPDGTMVPREEVEPPVASGAPAIAETATDDIQLAPVASDSASAPAASSAEVAATSQADTAPAARNDLAAQAANTDIAVAPVTGDAPQVTAAAADAAVAQGREVPAGQDGAVTATTPRATNPVTPTSVPLAPSRPGDQPVDIVGEVRNQAQPVALQPQSGEQASGWTMQIASQPTPEGAQTAYADLSRRYASVLEGKGVNIVKADIEGKGTYYRVRIPAGSRNEAIRMCESLKAAGGSCFVSR